MTDPFLPWLAGFIDGEGCITVTTAGKYRNAYVCIFQHKRHAPVLENIRERYGGFLGPQRGKDKSGNVYRLDIRSQTQVQALLHDVLPHLRIKTEKAHEALELVTDQLNARGKRRHRWARWEDDFLVRHHHLTASEVAPKLGRSEQAVWVRRQRLQSQ